MGERDIIRQVKSLRQNIAESGASAQLATLLSQLHDIHSKSKAGYLLRKVTFEELNQSKTSNIKPIKIAVISNFVCDEITNYIRTACLTDSIFADIYCADFNQYMWQLLDDDSELYQFSPDITLCLLDEHIFLDNMPADWLLEDYLNSMDSVLENITQAFNRYFHNSDKLLVTNTVVLGQEQHQLLIDYRSKMTLSQKFRQFNTAINEAFFEQSAGIVIDTDILLQQQNVELKRLNLSGFAKMHFSEELLDQFANECKKVAQTLLGNTKKCLVLDCDNTLWGGVVGDDGIAGITLGSSAEGELYARFQAAARQLGKQGIILALNSKNNRGNTDQVFSQHPDAILKTKDFSFQCVNWDPKHENLKTIAQHLNISCEHIVFVDDSDFECDMVRELLPEVAVVKLSGNPEEHLLQLTSPGFFNSRVLTAEDYTRSEKYRAESERKVEKNKHTDISGYLHSLNIAVDVSFADEFTLPRVAQITQRTNQFNLTTERLSEQDVQRLYLDDYCHILTVCVDDKFGSSGIVGCAIIDEKPDGSFHIRNLLLSCRVFSRGIETAIVGYIIRFAREKFASTVYGYFSETTKNQKFSGFYRENGFVADGHVNGETELNRYKLSELDFQSLFAKIPWVTLKTHTDNAVSTMEQ